MDAARPHWSGHYPPIAFGEHCSLIGRVAWRATRGLVRERHEDAMLVAVGPGLPVQLALGVFDGVGGQPAGDVASWTAIRAVYEYLSQDPEPYEYLKQKPTVDWLEVLLRGVAIHANKRAYDAQRASRDHAGMCTTMVLAVVRDNRLGVVHVGDSRAYLLRGGALHQLTGDHTIKALVERTGETSDNTALAAAIGVDKEVESEVYFGHVQAGDVLLLSTGGLHGVVSSDAIRSTLMPDVGGATWNAETMCRMLLDRVYAAGAPDNATVVILKVEAAT